jgi:hypothetical protein
MSTSLHPVASQKTVLFIYEIPFSCLDVKLYGMGSHKNILKKMNNLFRETGTSTIGKLYVNECHTYKSTRIQYNILALLIISILYEKATYKMYLSSIMMSGKLNVSEGTCCSVY